MIIECKRIWEDGKLMDMDLFVNAISFVGPFIPISSKTREEDKNSCAVAMNNGVVMRINIGRASLKQKIMAYRGQ